MDVEEVRQFKARWRLVNDYTAEEARNAAPALKLRQLALMYEAGQSLGWADASADDAAEVLDRWRRLRESVSLSVGAMELKVSTPEDLIITKAVAQRAKDLIDIEAI